MLRILLVTLGTEEGNPKEYKEEKGNTSLGMIGVWEMRDYGIFSTTGI
jgi:hypothetical protein